MTVDEALEELGRRMQRILDILAEGRRSLAVPEATEWKALALARWQMLRALSGFISYKNRCILDPLIRAADPVQAGRARAIEANNERLRQIYHEFVAHWSLHSPVFADAPYRNAALTMAAQIEAHVVADVQQIEALLRAPAVTGAA